MKRGPLVSLRSLLCLAAVAIACGGRPADSPTKPTCTLVCREADGSRDLGIVEKNV